MKTKCMIVVASCLALSPGAGDAQTSLTVDATIRRVIETHPGIRASAERVRAARGVRLTAGQWSNPVLTFHVENAALPGRSAPADLDREVSTSIAIPLEPLYQLWPRAAQASAELRAAEADLRVMRRETTLGAAAAFYAMGSAQVSVEALGEVRTWLDSLVMYTRNRVSEGAAAEVDLIRLEVEQGRVETDLAIARVALARSRAALAALIGSDSFGLDLGVLMDSSTIAALPPLSALQSVANIRRPEIHAADARLSAAGSAVSMERAAIVRELGVMGGVKSAAGTRSLLAGVSIPLPLFDQNRGGIERAAALRRVAVFERNQVERQVTADVSASYAAVQTLSQQVSRMGSGLLRRAEEARRIAEGAYREGATSLVQVLDAARAFAEARQVYYRAIFARQQSVIELNVAIGADDPGALLSIPTVSEPLPVGQRSRDNEDGC